MTLTPNDPILLTPGPLTTSHETKLAMLGDWGSRDEKFLKINERVCNRLLTIANAIGTHVCVPLQGSGTFIVEAALCTLIPKDGKALVLINGAYGKRISNILNYVNRTHITIEWQEDTPVDAIKIEQRLKSDDKISHVIVVHCETTSGILNPIPLIADVVKKYGRSLIIDSMSAFGAIPLDSKMVHFDAVLASSNKCLEGVPGLGFAIIRKSLLKNCKGNSHSLSLDLYEQWLAMDSNRQWRFTPPTHVIVAFDKALELFEKEGGVFARHARYQENARILITGMEALGFKAILSSDIQAPIIITFKMPKNLNFDFHNFYNGLQNRGFIIYPGKLTTMESFRIGCIGHVGAPELSSAIIAVQEVLIELNITRVR